MTNPKKCLYDLWIDGQAKNLNTFAQKLFEAFLAASGNNREKLTEAFPEFFKDSQYK